MPRATTQRRETETNARLSSLSARALLGTSRWCFHAPISPPTRVEKSDALSRPVDRTARSNNSRKNRRKIASMRTLAVHRATPTRKHRMGRTATEQTSTRFGHIFAPHRRRVQPRTSCKRTRTTGEDTGARPEGHTSGRSATDADRAAARANRPTNDRNKRMLPTVTSTRGRAA